MPHPSYHTHHATPTMPHPPHHTHHTTLATPPLASILMNIISHVFLFFSVLGLDIQDEMGRHEVGFQGDIVKIPVNEDGAHLYYACVCMLCHSLTLPSPLPSPPPPPSPLPLLPSPSPLSFPPPPKAGCRMEAQFFIKKMPGNFHLSTHSSRTQPEQVDMRHIIHRLEFGEDSLAGLHLKGSFNPLRDIDKTEMPGQREEDGLGGRRRMLAQFTYCSPPLPSPLLPSPPLPSPPCPSPPLPPLPSPLLPSPPLPSLPLPADHTHDYYMKIVPTSYLPYRGTKRSGYQYTYAYKVGQGGCRWVCLVTRPSYTYHTPLQSLTSWGHHRTLPGAHQYTVTCHLLHMHTHCWAAFTARQSLSVCLSVCLHSHLVQI